MTYYIHNIDPVLVHLGPLQIRWYGLMYLVGYFVGYLILMRRHKNGFNILDSEGNQALITYIMIGMIIGARLIYVSVYNPVYYMNHLSEIPAVWQGGLSFHGAILGYAVAVALFSRKYKIQFYHLVDNICFGGSVGIFFGRLGNFINGELYGRFTDVPWGVIFPDGGPMPRHPSQLYQAFGEGLMVFVLLHFVQKYEQKRGYAPDLEKAMIEQSKDGKPPKKVKIIWKRTGVITSSFLILYGIARIIVEFFREPDAQLGFFAQYFSMGQILCLIMIISGSIMMWDVMRRPREQTYIYDVK
jgi:phosphatidylglycerol:prolipoprotein diacylglycerol transferase